MLKAIILIIIGIAGFILGAVIALCGLLMFNGLAVSGIWSYVILFTTLFFSCFYLHRSSLIYKTNTL